MSLLQVLPHSPNLSSYTSLSEHQSTTPSTFFSATPVLHFRCETCQVGVGADLLAENAALRSVFGPAPNGSTSAMDEARIDGIDLFVGSNAFILYNSNTQKSLSIPYPSITLHALKQEPLLSSPNTKLFKIYLQISSDSGNGGNDDSLDTLLELAIVPLLGGYHSTISSEPEVEMMDMDTDQPTASENTTSGPNNIQVTQETLAKSLFAALSRCSNLYPTQPANTLFSINGNHSDDGGGEYYDYSEELGDGVIPFSAFRPGGGMPGEGGWITSENVDQFQVPPQEGNAGPLGPGAGNVRPREDEHEEDGVDGGKWRRTD